MPAEIGQLTSLTHLDLAGNQLTSVPTAICELRAAGDFAVLTDADLAAFREILGDDNVRTDARSLDACNEDWIGKYRENAGVLLLPARTSQVSAILRYRNARARGRAPGRQHRAQGRRRRPGARRDCPRTRRMNAVLSVDPVAGTVVCEAGCVLADLEHALNARGMTAPLDLGAKGSQIGGNVSTNAGGLQLGSATLSAGSLAPCSVN